MTQRNKTIRRLANAQHREGTRYGKLDLARKAAEHRRKLNQAATIEGDTDDRNQNAGRTRPVTFTDDRPGGAPGNPLSATLDKLQEFFAGRVHGKSPEPQEVFHDYSRSRGAADLLHASHTSFTAALDDAAHAGVSIPVLAAAWMQRSGARQDWRRFCRFFQIREDQIPGILRQAVAELAPRLSAIYSPQSQTVRPRVNHDEKKAAVRANRLRRAVRAKPRARRKTLTPKK